MSLNGVESGHAPVLSAVSGYGSSQVAGLCILVAAACLSGFAAWIGFFVIATHSSQYRNTHIAAFLCSLLAANVIQAAGTAMNGKWASTRATESGGYCGLQGGLKQAGNVGAALWSFILSAHIFTLLFLRWKHTMLSCCLTLALGWLFVGLIVGIGPIAIQDHRGPYFGPTGLWCWISGAYPYAQFWLEYFLEFLSAGLSLILYAIILLRVRGNLYKNEGVWGLRFLPRGQSWQLAFQRDLVDASMLRVAARIVWFPLAYTLLLLPMGIARLLAFCGIKVSFWATVATGTIFSLQGLTNIMLLLITRRVLPDSSNLPDLSAPRRTIDMSSHITPFILPPKECEPRADPEVGLSRAESNESFGTDSSTNSVTPMLEVPTSSGWGLSQPVSVVRN